MFDPIPVAGKLLEEIYIFCRSYPLGRPRARKDVRGGVYQPLENQFEIREELMAWHKDQPINQPLCLSVRIFYQKPAYNPLPHVTRYDADNLLKAVCDNLQFCGIVRDDCLFVRKDIAKAFGCEDYMVIRIHEVEHEIEEIPGQSPDEDNFVC